MQREWMKQRAEAKGLGLQAYFNELMSGEQYSPWVNDKETLRAIPTEACAVVDWVCEIFRSERRDLIHLLTENTRALKSVLGGRS